MWDSAGQERYKSLIPSYVRGASVIFVVYDSNSNIIIIEEPETFASVPNWISFIKNIENPLIVLCSNKIDLENNVEPGEAEKLATKEGLSFFEVSAKTGLNVKKMFFSIVSELPFFEQFSVNNKNKLINELENENNETQTDIIDPPSIQEQKPNHNNQCKC